MPRPGDRRAPQGQTRGQARSRKPAQHGPVCAGPDGANILIQPEGFTSGGSHRVQRREVKPEAGGYQRALIVAIDAERVEEIAEPIEPMDGHETEEGNSPDPLAPIIRSHTTEF